MRGIAGCCRGGLLLGVLLGAVACAGAADDTVGPGAGEAPASWAEQFRSIYQAPEAASVCVPMHACGLLEPGYDDNAAFPFAMCMMLDNADTPGRRARQACVDDAGRDCAALKACLQGGSWGADGRGDCRNGVVLYPDATGYLGAGTRCDVRAFRGACHGGACVPDVPGATLAAGGAKNTCSGTDLVVATEGWFQGGIQAVTFTEPCGDGFACQAGVGGRDATCVPTGAGTGGPVGFTCSGATLVLVTENASTYQYDCPAYGYATCKAGHCAR